MTDDTDLRERLWDEAGRDSASVDAEAVLRAGVHARRKRRAAVLSVTAVTAGLAAAAVWHSGPLTLGPVHIAGPGPSSSTGIEPAPSGTTTEPAQSVAPEPGDPAYVWPAEGGYTTQTGWWDAPGLPRYEEVAAEHERILVVNTAAMYIFEDNILVPEFVSRHPTEPIPVNPDWPADSIVVLDAESLEVIDSEPAHELFDPWVFRPIDPGSMDPVPPEIAAAWDDLVPGYTLTSTSQFTYPDSEEQGFLYEDGTGLTIWVNVTRGDDRLPALPGLWDGTAEHHTIDVPGLTEARWARSEYGGAANGVNPSGTCQVTVTHQQLWEPIVTVSDAQVTTLVTELFPRAAALACT